MDTHDDKIYPFTRIVGVIVIPFLWLAFLILYFFPDTSGERFAWAIKPHMTALYMGAGYLGGSWLFINAIFGKRWHRIQGGFLPITTFTWFMLLATFLHWNRFSHGSLGFALWLILYVVTPFLVPTIWFFNRRSDSGQPEAHDPLIATPILWILRAIGVGSLLFVLLGFSNPAFAIQAWPWTLTPLTARVMMGWIGLLGVGALIMSFEKRWSGWRVPLEAIVTWHILVLVAAFMNVPDFKTGIVNWYTIAITVMVVATLIFYPLMEMRHGQA
jgi:hypothetical protein